MQVTAQHLVWRRVAGHWRMLMRLLARDGSGVLSLCAELLQRG